MVFFFSVLGKGNIPKQEEWINIKSVTPTAISYDVQKQNRKKVQKDDILQSWHLGALDFSFPHKS